MSAYLVSDSTTSWFYRRNLPNWYAQGAPIFLAWRLYGSLPQNTARNGCAMKESTGRKFRRLDAPLDRSSSDPVWLRDPRVAASVVSALQKGSAILHYFELHAFDRHAQPRSPRLGANSLLSRSDKHGKTNRSTTGSAISGNLLGLAPTLNSILFPPV
jgi:hypothetical protein